MGLRELFKRKGVDSERLKELIAERKIQRLAEQREKGSDERELERFIEEERQKSIKKNLEEFRKVRQKEAMATTVLNGKNMFKGKGNIASGETTVLKNNHKLLSMGKDKKERGLFFK